MDAEQGMPDQSVVEPVSGSGAGMISHRGKHGLYELHKESLLKKNQLKM